MTSEVDDRRFAGDVEREREAVETRCGELVAALVGGPVEIREAIRYALLGGGKRLRPILCLWTYDMLGGKQRDACLDVACALECLHTYSLIHDDLPCMDDDDMRRGRPSCHVRFGEANAVLAGDALLTLSFEILATVPKRWHVAGVTMVEAVRVLAQLSGSAGLIGGQVLDLMGDRLEQSVELVDEIHRMKTAALIAASMECGAVLAGAPATDRDRVRNAGITAGRAFQIVDDVLDIETSAEQLGKTPGKDVAAGKLTYPAVEGVEASKRQAAGLIETAKAEIAAYEGSGSLSYLFDYIVQRSA
jgi:geranylgeranyl diphosphate synthase type II